MTLKIETGTKNKTLRTVSVPIKAVTGELRSFALDMVKSMEEENGVGIAAPQVGRNVRMVICKFNPTGKNEVLVPMINPVLLDISDEEEEGEEGCLSVPKTWGMVKRAKRITLRYTNLKGKEMTLELSDFNARIVQHEIDHLDGILFVDKATDLKKTGKDKEDGPHI